MEEFKRRFFTFLWGVGYSVLMVLLTWAASNVDLINQAITELLSTNPKLALLLSSLLTILLQQAGKALRNTGNMPLVK